MKGYLGVALRSGSAKLGVLAAAGGFAIAGTLGGAVGLVAGIAAARRAQAVLVAGAAALAAAAAFTVLERPLTEGGIANFPLDRPLAELAGKVAGVLLLAGIVGIAATEWRSYRPGRVGNAGGNASSMSEAPAGRRVPASTIASILAVALLAALVLWQIGDRRWASAAPAGAITVLGLACVFAVAALLGSRVSVRVGPAPGPAAMLNGLRREHAQMLSGSMWLLAATLMISLGSFTFWLLVTQSVPAADVGRAAALFSATLFVGYLTSLGLPIAVSRYASDRTPDSASLFTWSLVLTIASSLVGVALFAAVAPESIRDGVAAWRAELAWLAVFLLVAGLSISALVDVRLMVLRRWPLVFVRSLLIAVLRLPFLLWVPSAGAALYVYVVAAGGFAVTAVAFLVPLSRRHGLHLGRIPSNATRALRFAGVNYFGQLAVQAPFFGVPFVVLLQVDAVENAHFYLSWAVMSVVYIGVQMIGQAYLVEGDRGGVDHRHQAGVALGTGLAVASLATVVSFGFGPLLAAVYGPGYGPVATLLPILVAGTIPFAVTTTLLTVARIRERSYSTVAVALAFAGAVLVPTVLLTAQEGALGAAWGWMAGNAIAAALALLVSRFSSRVRAGRSWRESSPLLRPTGSSQPLRRGH